MRKRAIVGGIAATMAAVLASTFGPVGGSAAWASARVCSGNPGSNGMTCVIVQGTGLYVESVNTTLTRNHFNSCAVPKITLHLQTISSSPICAARSLELGSVPILRNLPRGSKVCASWSAPDPANKPCATIG